MCGIRENWPSIMQAGEEYVAERNYLEPDDADDGSMQEETVNSNGIQCLEQVRVSPYLSNSGVNIGDAVFLDNWFDELSQADFCRLWEKYEQKIKALVRYPGGYHEWLMVAALPELKGMGIPMGLIRKMIVPTSECFFYVQNEKCWHGSRGSGSMHRDLFKTIVMTYYEERAFDGNTYVQNNMVNYIDKLRINLAAFFMVYYPEETCFPREVREFLGIEGYRGE